MSNVKFFKTTSDNLPPISDGQFIAVTDTGEIYIDTGEERKVYGGADFSGTGEYSVQIGSEAEATANSSTSIGFEASATAISTLAIGKGAIAEGAGAISIGEGTKTSGFCSIQLGAGENSVDGTFSVGLLDNYVLLESDGKIPDERLNDTIARVADIPDIPDTSNFITTETFDNKLNAANVVIGAYSSSTGSSSIAIGSDSLSTIGTGIAIGWGAEATADGAIQLGFGTNSEQYTLSVGWYKILDGMEKVNYTLLTSDGKIPDERLNDTIARVADIPDTSNFATLEDIPTNYLTEDDIYSSSGFGVLIGKSTGTSVSEVGGIAIGQNAIDYGNGVTIGNNCTNPGGGVVIGEYCKCTNNSHSIAIGKYAANNNSQIAIAIGHSAKTTANYAIQIGKGTNGNVGTLNVSLGSTEDKNYTLLTNDGKIPIERIPDGVGGSSWTKTTDTSTTEISLTIADQNEYVYNASATSVSITVTDFTGESVVHFSSGSTASTFTCAAKMIGYHCYGGTFTPVKNTRYSIMFSHDGLNVIGHVGGYANG